MSNPHEYREALWSVLYNGELTEEMKRNTQKNAAENARKAIGKPAPKSALDELEALKAQAAALRAAKATSPAALPKAT
jgi:hypothetical protein